MNVDATILNKILVNWFQKRIKKNYTPWPNVICPTYARLIQHLKSINVIHHINRVKKKKNCTIISKDAEKSFDKIQDPFVIKTLNKLGMKTPFTMDTSHPYWLVSGYKGPDSVGEYPWRSMPALEQLLWLNETFVETGRTWIAVQLFPLTSASPSLSHRRSQSHSSITFLHNKSLS